MRKPLSILLLLMIVAPFIHAQNVAVRGFVTDKDNNQPLALCAIQVKNSQLGALTEDNGFFVLPLPINNLQDSVKISFIGYLPKTISIAGYKQGDTLKIQLETAIETKQEAVIVAENAKGVLLKAIANLSKNLYRDSIIQTGFYRQFHRENGKYVRLLEADINVAMNCKSRLYYSFHERMQVNHQRRSENYETNGDVHGDHVADLLKENPFSYNKGTFLNPRNIDFFAPKFEHEDTSEYIIKTQYKENSSKTIDKARIWVQKGTYAITRIEIEKFPNPHYVKTQYEIESRWKLVNEKDVIQLTLYKGKFVVSSMERVYNHHVVNLATGQVEYVVEESFDLYFYKYDTENVTGKLDAGRYSDMTSLYTGKYGYNDKFWNNYTMLKEHKLPEQVQKDLEHAQPLDKQFHDEGK